MTVYVLYDNDDVLGVGTAKELGIMIGVKPQTIMGYAAESHKSRGIGRTAEKFIVRPEDFATMRR